MAAGEPYGGELVLYRDGGAAFPADLRFTPLRNGSRITHYVGTVVDATERRRLQEQVQLAQKMEAVGRLAGGVAHDFNARDALPEGGRVTIGTSREILSEGFPGRGAPVRPGPYIRIAVTDTGAGMTAETMSHLFEPFFTTKERGEGTGLGLATVYGIVEQSGGVITVQSRPGAGSTFSIYLPEAAGVAPEAPRPAALASARGTETILVVEDEASVRELVKRVLIKRGYTVHAAASAAEAIELIEGLGRRVDLLVSDVIMPGLSGPRLAERLARRLPGLRVLFISGYTENSLAPHGVLEARTHLLQKPFTPSALTGKIREILDHGGA